MSSPNASAEANVASGTQSNIQSKLLKPARVVAIGPTNHGIDIMISDVDAVKPHHKDPDYKYKDPRSHLIALEHLMRQYKLRYRTAKANAGPLAPARGIKIFEAFKKSVKGYIEDDNLENFWIHGTDVLSNTKIKSIRNLSGYLQETGFAAKYDAISAIWRLSEVAGALRDQCQANDSLPVD